MVHEVVGVRIVDQCLSIVDDPYNMEEVVVHVAYFDFSLIAVGFFDALLSNFKSLLTIISLC